MYVRLLIAAVLLPVLAGCGVSGNVRNDPGYAAFDSLRQLESSENLSLSFGAMPLQLARFVLDDDHGDARALLAELRAVRVHVLEGRDDARSFADGIEELKADLLREGWVTVVTVREGAERASVLLRPGRAGAIHGVTVIAQEPNEAVLVNLVGNVRLDLLNDYMAELNVDTPRVDIDSARWRHSRQ
jgi:hypothetical protein